MFRGFQSRRYDVPTRAIFIIGGGVGIAVSYVFSVRGFGTQIPDMLWAARGIVIFFIALQIYVNRNKSEEQRNWALIVGGLASYIYGIWTNITGILSFGGMTIDMINMHNWYYMIIPVMVGFPLEIAPEALLMMGFFPDNDTVMSDALSGLAGFWRSMTGDVGQPRRPTVRTMTARPGMGRTALEQRYRPPASPAPPVTRQTSSPSAPTPPAYHAIGEDDDE